MKKELPEQHEAQDVIRVNLKMNVLNGMKGNNDILYGYSYGAILCAANGRDDRYEETFELAEEFSEGIEMLFEDMEDQPELENTIIEMKTENFTFDINYSVYFNDIDIFCIKTPKKEKEETIKSDESNK